MLPAQADISICLLASPRGPVPDKLLTSLFATADPVAVEAVVLCNGPEPSWLAPLDHLFPQTKFVVSRPGRPAVRALNTCLRHAGGRYLFLLRADAVLQAGSLLELTGHLDDNPTIGACAPQFVSFAGDTWSPARPFPSLFSLLRKFTGLAPREEKAATPRQDFWLPADAVVFRRETLFEIGLFDERFHFFYHDADLCRRILRTGWHLAVVPGARIVLPRPLPRPPVLDPLPSFAASPLAISPLQLLDATRFLLHRAADRTPSSANLSLEREEEIAC